MQLDENAGLCVPHSRGCSTAVLKYCQKTGTESVDGVNRLLAVLRYHMNIAKMIYPKLRLINASHIQPTRCQLQCIILSSTQCQTKVCVVRHPHTHSWIGFVGWFGERGVQCGRTGASIAAAPMQMFLLFPNIMGWGGVGSVLVNLWQCLLTVVCDCSRGRVTALMFQGRICS